MTIKKVKVYIGIDPGKSGGIVGLVDTDVGIVVATCSAFKELSEAKANLEWCKEYSQNCEALIENVHAFPTDGRSSAFKFGKNAGQWEGLLSAMDIPLTKVVPSKWMHWYGDIPKNKQERKNHLKAIANDKLQNEIGCDYKATLKTADAFLISYFHLKGGLND